MNASLSRLILTPVLALALFTVCNTALAQGTATGPITAHNIDPGPIVLIGDAVNPIPIDLDPLGQPWIKDISDPNGLTANGGPLDIVETIRNVGNESWFDWHEHILLNNGLVPGIWAQVSLQVNGNPIGFNQVGLGTLDLWLDNFSQPVLPGDILTIRKLVDLFPGTSGTTGSPRISIAEYPTPEPASLGLMGIGSLVVLGKRRSISQSAE